ncbi:hypothetical protein PoB_000762900 [Plakobranchus ocellatus]|uniref:G-protein coupled receptors family 1 profile domain-containing protein n=1 Tax=Plakobranchus ocellatus TaxID=259542 RepID=A0AAV3YFP5_9GAST|nr:hypothetical protein PoB_000762900 [Plakobranchus ocellatus]
MRRFYSSVPATGCGQTPDKTDNQGLSAKDLHVIQSVVLVCNIFIMSQAPFLVYLTVRLIVPEFDANRQFHFMFTISTVTSLTCSYLNATVNIIVYYNFNSKYKLELLSLLKTASQKSRNNNFIKLIENRFEEHDRQCVFRQGTWKRRRGQKNSLK